MCTREPRLVLVSLLIGWKNGARTLNQSLSEVIINQSSYLITFDNQLKTTESTGWTIRWIALSTFWTTGARCIVLCLHHYTKTTNVLKPTQPKYPWLMAVSIEVASVAFFRQLCWSPVGYLSLERIEPCWWTEQCTKMSFGNLTLLLCKTPGAIYIVLHTNMAVSSRGWKPRIDQTTITGISVSYSLRIFHPRLDR